MLFLRNIGKENERQKGQVEAIFTKPVYLSRGQKTSPAQQKNTQSVSKQVIHGKYTFKKTNNKKESLFSDRYTSDIEFFLSE